MYEDEQNHLQSLYLNFVLISMKILNYTILQEKLRMNEAKKIPDEEPGCYVHIFYHDALYE